MQKGISHILTNALLRVCEAFIQLKGNFRTKSLHWFNIIYHSSIYYAFIGRERHRCLCVRKIYGYGFIVL